MRLGVPAREKKRVASEKIWTGQGENEYKQRAEETESATRQREARENDARWASSHSWSVRITPSREA